MPHNRQNHTKNTALFDVASASVLPSPPTSFPPGWVQYHHRVRGLVDSKIVPIPVNIETVNKLLGLTIRNTDDMRKWLAANQVKPAGMPLWSRPSVGRPGGQLSVCRHVRSLSISVRVCASNYCCSETFRVGFLQVLLPSPPPRCG